MPAPTRPPKPSFSDALYWDTRFASSSEPANFDWLLPAEEGRVDALVRAAIGDDGGDEEGRARARILHIGCGTSALSLRLREFVRHANQVHNTDFSRVAVEQGRQAEAEAEAAAAAAGGGDAGGQAEREDGHNTAAGAETRDRMQWSTLDLLSLGDVRALVDTSPPSSPQLYTLILDKSTSDAISCGPDVSLPLPYPPVDTESLSMNSSPATAGAQPAAPSTRLHPLHVLALHLALLTRPRGTWLAVSYSSARFPFLEPFPSRQDEGRLEWEDERCVGGFTHPGRLWTLESKEGVELPCGEGEQAEGTPRTVHWVYVLRRTEVPVR